MSLPRFMSLWGPVVALMALVWVLGGQIDVPGIERIWDKALHASAYALIGFFGLRACHGGRRAPRLGTTLAGLALTVGYGALNEWRQLYVPGRTASALDWVADAVGAAIALAMFAVWTGSGRQSTDRG